MEQIKANGSKQPPPADEMPSSENKKQRKLVENIRITHFTVSDSVPLKDHIKNYVKLCNRLGIDMVCWLDYLYSKEPRPPVSIANGQDYLLPMSVKCEYTENYQAL